ncbi:MAG TPA: diaminopimelate decarboxylase [Planctomycetota bacterium]|nr:diaminopimelate decarboxylase [Planctomycetota bacterium]
MDHFRYRDLELFCEDVRLVELAASVGTPAYVYSRATIEHHWARLVEAFAWAHPLICYSVKACSNLAVLRVFVELGAGFDVVSGSEIDRVVKAGGDPSKIVFAGVGKSDDEIALGLAEGIHLFTVESEPELDAIESVAARLGKRARVALRVNPDVDPKTHRYMSTGKRESKFGIDLERASAVLARRSAFPHLDFAGVHAHIGSQITSVDPYVLALGRVARFIRAQESAGVKIDTLDVGGGFGIFYRVGEALTAKEFARAIRPVVEPLGRQIVMEPGRFIVGNAGVLLTRVVFVKQSGDKRFVVVDAAMNDLIRPTLYGAEHRIWPVRPPFEPDDARGRDLARVDIVGPICESGDFLALDRPFPEVRRGDLVAVFSAGAYGMTMSSNYNSRLRAPEVLVEGKTFRVVRRRETLDDLTRLETT